MLRAAKDLLPKEALAVRSTFREMLANPATYTDYDCLRTVYPRGMFGGTSNRGLMSLTIARGLITGLGSGPDLSTSGD